MVLRIQNTINVRYCINSFKVKIFVFFNNPQITNAQVKNLLKFKITNFFKWSMLVGISEAIRSLLIYLLKCTFVFNKNNVYLINSIKCSSIIPLKFLESKFSDNTDSFNEWLAGIIDGDGCFLMSKKGYASLEITIKLRDVRCLNLIKQKYGGSVKVRANQNHLRYRLHHKKGLIHLINNINGLIRNPTRILQLLKICNKYEIPLYQPKPLIYNNGWLSGFIDSDGSIYFNEQSGQVFIGITQKNKYLLEPLIQLYGGRIDICSPKIDAFKYIVYRKNELFNLIDNYFCLYPLRTKKSNRLHLIKQFYLVRISKNNQNLNKLNEWILFKDKWEKYKD